MNTKKQGKQWRYYYEGRLEIDWTSQSAKKDKGQINKRSKTATVQTRAMFLGMVPERANITIRLAQGLEEWKREAGANEKQRSC